MNDTCYSSLDMSKLGRMLWGLSPIQVLGLCGGSWGGLGRFQVLGSRSMYWIVVEPGSKGSKGSESSQGYKRFPGFLSSHKFPRFPRYWLYWSWVLGSGFPLLDCIGAGFWVPKVPR